MLTVTSSPVSWLAATGVAALTVGGLDSELFVVGKLAGVPQPRSAAVEEGVSKLLPVCQVEEPLPRQRNSRAVGCECCISV